MLELGLSELFLVGIVALIIVGPKDLPRMFQVVGKYVGRAKAMARDFQRSFESAAKETGFDDLKNNINTLQEFSPNNISKNVLKENINSDKVSKSTSSPTIDKNANQRTAKSSVKKGNLNTKATVKNLPSEEKGKVRRLFY